MTSVADVLSTARSTATGAVIGYLPIGFPDFSTSVDAAVALVDNGVDVLELGIPYSDPVMDGPVIQAASQVALSQGFRLRQAFDAVKAIRARVDAPILIMTYWNPVLRFGVDRFADELVAVGASGLITPDLIPDEAAEWLATSERTGLDRVFLAAPTSSDERLTRVSEVSRGFVYAVSTMGTTGERNDVDRAARTLVGRLREHGSSFVCVGVGISNPVHVAEVLCYADGAIVGSALVKALAEGGVSGVGATAQALANGKSRRQEV